VAFKYCFHFYLSIFHGYGGKQLTPNVGMGEFFQLWTHGSLEVIYTISDQIANRDALRIDCLCCLEATQKIEDFYHCTSVGVGSSKVTIGI
jgi:hypothetical protein